MKKKNFTIFVAVVLAVILFVVVKPGIYAPMTGTAVDAVTGQPIQGAVVLVEWTKTHGVGEHWTESVKAEEAVTDKGGKFTVAGLDARSVNSPDVTVYKRGYVAWNNKYIFPSYEKRNDFQWGGSYIFRLVNFDEKKYRHTQHILFIYKPVAEGSKIPRFYEAKRWEELMMQMEIEKQ